MADKTTCPRVFVYGTLKMHESASYMLRDAEFIGEARTVSQGWSLYDLGGFPAVTYGIGYVYGELYEINPQDTRTLARLDRYEGHPDFYLRRLSFFSLVEDDTSHYDAWMYTLSTAHKGKLLPEGRWTRRAA